MPIKTLVSNIKHLRKANNLSQVDLARALGMAVTNKSSKIIGHWESFRAEPQTYHMALLSHLFGVSINDLCRKDIGGK